MAAIAKLTARHSSISSNLRKQFANFSSTMTKSRTTPLTTKTLIPLKPHYQKPVFPKLLSTNASQSGSENSDSDNEENPKTTNRDIHKPNLPPPYDPFNKKPVIQEPKDPKNLPEIFHNIRHGDGLMNFAVKMFDGLSKDGLTHEALELFAQIKDGGSMPDVVAHTAVVEAYVNAGKAKEALRAFVRMQACGVRPNAYGYGVVIKGLVGCGDRKMFNEGRKCVVEMLGKGMRVNGGVCVAVFEAFVRMGMVEEGREFLEVMKGKGFVVDEKEVREVLKGKRGVEFRGVMDILFGK